MDSPKYDAAVRCLSSAVGAGIAEIVTLPADMAKVRLQVQNNRALGGAPEYRGMVHCIYTIGAQEGPAALWKGLAPALLRQINYTSLAFVLYEPVRNFYAGLGHPGAPPTFAQRLLAGGTAGSIAISVFNPTEVLKTRLQTAKVKVSMREVASAIYARDGIRGFWAGYGPNVARTFLVNAAELGAYDEAKTALQPHFGNGLATHVASSGVAGLCSASVSTPADVVKTRLMNSAGRSEEGASGGILHVVRSVLRDEGPMAFYKGFTPILVRKICWCTVFFVSYEKMRAAANEALL